ncbi:hypothetical protein ASZ78_010213 [Callipepla squamata]|uniref:DUF4587 domain-containing protein n=1 Tax=Callipepla squamata TaxID=9009 RepID=A0A226N1Q4_CALSU|nr:hypothetical protein ASZ78_010213 [Callipepla squamata]
MTDPSMVDCMTQLKLKLLEKRLENEQRNLEKTESPFPAARSRHEDMLQSALKQRKNLLQELRMPPQPATIIQQLPQPPPLIAQIPAAPSFAYPRSGSIKEDMVEMMLMQNAQMHQIIMQNMMLKSLPPMAFAQPARPSYPLLQHVQQVVLLCQRASLLMATKTSLLIFNKDLQHTAPMAVKADRPWLSAVHHHHHYTPPELPLHAMPAGLLMPGEGLPPASSAQCRTSSMLPALKM